jgi:hypothetical protein
LGQARHGAAEVLRRPQANHQHSAKEFYAVVEADILDQPILPRGPALRGGLHSQPTQSFAEVGQSARLSLSLKKQVDHVAIWVKIRRSNSNVSIHSRALEQLPNLLRNLFAR